MTYSITRRWTWSTCCRTCTTSCLRGQRRGSCSRSCATSSRTNRCPRVLAGWAQLAVALAPVATAVVVGAHVPSQHRGVVPLGARIHSSRARPRCARCATPQTSARVVFARRTRRTASSKAPPATATRCTRRTPTPGPPVRPAVLRRRHAHLLAGDLPRAHRKDHHGVPALRGGGDGGVVVRCRLPGPDRKWPPLSTPTQAVFAEPPPHALPQADPYLDCKELRPSLLTRRVLVERGRSSARRGGDRVQQEAAGQTMPKPTRASRRLSSNSGTSRCAWSAAGRADDSRALVNEGREARQARVHKAPHLHIDTAFFIPRASSPSRRPRLHPSLTPLPPPPSSSALSRPNQRRFPCQTVSTASAVPTGELPSRRFRKNAKLRKPGFDPGTSGCHT